MTQITSYTEQPERLSPIEQQKILDQRGGYRHSDAMWFNPVDECHYSGEFSENRPSWDKSNIVLNSKENRRVRELAAEGKYTDIIGIKTAGYSDEIYPKVLEYIDIQNRFAAGEKNALENNLAQGGMLQRDDYVNVKTLEVENRIVLAKPQAHVLTNVVERVATSEFSFKWYKITNPFDVIVKKVSDQQTFHTGTLKYETDTAKLDIYGAEIGTTWEFRQETFDVPIYQHHLQNLEGQFDRARNEAISTVINDITTTGGGGDWDATSGTPPQHTTNPIPDIEFLADAVNDENLGEASIIVSDKKVWRAYAASTPWVVGNTFAQSPVVNPINYKSTLNFVENNVPVFPGFRWVVDNLITAEQITVMAPNSIRFWDGPQRTITWTHEQTDEEGTIYKAYFACKNLETKLQEKYGSILS